MSSISSVISSVTLRFPWLEHITHDLYGIAERIREIDKGYFIVRNRLNNKYEVHHIDTFPNTYQFRVPFSELDARTLEHCRMTMVQNSDRLIKEMDRNNELIEARRKATIKNEIEGIALETANDLRRAD